MKLSLFKIEQEYLNLAEAIINNGGELSPELETALEINKEQLQTKGQCYGFIVRELEAETDIIDSEIKRLQALKSSRNKTVDRLKETLTKAMDLYEIEKLETPTLKISFRKSESVEIEHPELLEAQFLETKTTVTPNKTKIKEAIKSGEFVTGAVIKQNKNIQIR